MKNLFIMILLLASLEVNADSHSLWMMATFLKGDTPFPEFSAIFLLDDIQIGYYDANKQVYRGQNNSNSQPDTSDINSVGRFIGYVHGRMRERADYLRNYLNYTNNVTVFQRAAGCELLDDGQPGGVSSRDAFNGESGDARHYDPQLNTLHTERVWPEAVDKKWPVNFHFLYQTIYLPNCIIMLKKHLVKAEKRVLKKVNPIVKLIQKQGKDSTVVLTCLATGFYPRHINLTLLRDGQPVPDHQITGGEQLPNGDETYQMRKSLEVRPEELQQHHYTCTAQHLSLDNKLDTPLDYDWDSVTTSIVPYVLAIFVCLLGAVAIIIMCKKVKGGHVQVKNYAGAKNTEPDEMEETEHMAAGEHEMKEHARKL